MLSSFSQCKYFNGSVVVGRWICTSTSSFITCDFGQMIEKPQFKFWFWLSPV